MFSTDKKVVSQSPLNCRDDKIMSHKYGHNGEFRPEEQI